MDPGPCLPLNVIKSFGFLFYYFILLLTFSSWIPHKLLTLSFKVLQDQGPVLAIQIKYSNWEEGGHFRIPAAHRYGNQERA